MKRARIALGTLLGLAVLLVWESTGSAQAADGGYKVFRPDGAGPHPAIAFLSGCSGFTPSVAPKAYERVAEQLRGQGYLVVFVDYLGRRGFQSCGGVPISHADAASDLATAVRWLRSQPSVDPTRISAIGWSYGGGAVLVALASHSQEQLGIARAVVYYPDCRMVQPWKAATPVLMLLAGDDNVAPGMPCQVAVEKNANPAAVKTVVFPGALHAFDVPELPARMARGTTGAIGYHPQAAAAAWAEVQKFLAQTK
jgi:dienelactone hydrolase